MNRHLEAEQQYIKATQLYSTYFPHSTEYACCSYNLGVLYGNTGRRREAIEKLEEARELYERVGTQADLDRYDQFIQTLYRN